MRQPTNALVALLDAVGQYGDAVLTERDTIGEDLEQLATESVRKIEETVGTAALRNVGLQCVANDMTLAVSYFDEQDWDAIRRIAERVYVSNAIRAAHKELKTTGGGWCPCQTCLEKRQRARAIAKLCIGRKARCPLVEELIAAASALPPSHDPGCV